MKDTVENCLRSRRVMKDMNKEEGKLTEGKLTGTKPTGIKKKVYGVEGQCGCCKGKINNTYSYCPFCGNKIDWKMD